MYLLGLIFLSPESFICLLCFGFLCEEAVYLKEQGHVCFVNYWEFWFLATGILLRPYVMTSIAPGVGDRGVLGPRFVRGELPVQRWGWMSTLTLDGCLRPAQNLPRRGD